MMIKSNIADRVLDITAETCPMTYVRTRLALDSLISGQTLAVLLCGEDPRRNVPLTAIEQGHTILDDTTGADGITRLVIRKG